MSAAIEDQTRTDANASAVSGPRVVFFGDSITQMWDLERWFPGKAYVNRGISAEATPQMLVRFKTDVIDLDPAVVVILAGTNDIAGHAGPMTLEQIGKNFESMAVRAQQHGIRVVFSSVLPVHFRSLRALRNLVARPPKRIRRLNAWLKEYCRSQRLVYIDYHSSMIDKRGQMRKDLAPDGVHPNEAGYAIMAALARAAIDRALISPA